MTSYKLPGTPYYVYSPYYSFFSPPPPPPNSHHNHSFRNTLITLAFVCGGVAFLGVVIFLIIRGLLSLNKSSPPRPTNEKKKPPGMENFLVEIIQQKPIMYSSQKINIITNNFEHILGKGGFGVVYKGALDDGVVVAVKVLNANLSDRLIKKQFKAEVNSIGRTHHFNLVRLYGFCFEEGLKALVYEFMENGSLDGFLFNDKKRNKIQWEKLHNIAIGTAKGIAYLHEDCRDGRIIHYDIKPENVLLDKNFSPKVADFGLANLCSRDATHVTKTSCKGTYGYAAPEMFLQFPITYKCDVYSFGMVLFNILGRCRNLDAKASESQQWLPRRVWKKFGEGALGEMVMGLGIEEKDRMKAERMAMIAFWCIQRQPELRPSMSSVVKMLEGELNFNQPPNPFPPCSLDCVIEFQESSDASSSSFAPTIWKTPLSR